MNLESATNAVLHFNLESALMKFTIYARDQLVGHSSLENGDPPMGVAFGVFEALPAYDNIRQECCSNHADQSLLNLSARAPDGTVIPCIGIAILDYSKELDEAYVEVNLLGIGYPLYGELFPQHVARYESQFK
jgi:hypothetical protein